MASKGEPLRLSVGASTVTLLEKVQVSTPRVAVERDRIVLKAEYASTQLAEGDELEVVEFVGGG